MTSRRVVLALWLVAWAGFGIPWDSYSPRPHLENVRWDPLPRERRLRWFNRNRVDDALNVLFYAPVGWSGAAAGWPFASIVGSATALSLATEAAQVFSTERTPSIVDLLTNVSGAVLGLALARRNRHRTDPSQIRGRPNPSGTRSV